jgi:hypothetical protein
MLPKTPGAGVTVGIGVEVGVALGVEVGVTVGVTLGVEVGVADGVGVGGTVGVALGLGEGVGVGVTTGPVRRARQTRLTPLYWLKSPPTRSLLSSWMASAETAGKLVAKAVGGRDSEACSSIEGRIRCAAAGQAPE